MIKIKFSSFLLLMTFVFANALKGGESDNQQRSRRRRRLRKSNAGYYTYSQNRGGVSKARETASSSTPAPEAPRSLKPTTRPAVPVAIRPPSNEPTFPAPVSVFRPVGVPSEGPVEIIPSITPTGTPTAPASSPTEYEYTYDDPRITYTVLGSPSWPSDSTWQRELGARLSVNATLINNIMPTIEEYEQLCWSNTTIEDWLEGGNGICVIEDECQYRFCNFDDSKVLNAPAYTVDVRSPADIQAAFQFAEKYNIQVSVKTSGHNGASSLLKDSLSIWMANYPKDGTIRHDFVDSCGDQSSAPPSATIGISGGELFNDVLARVGASHHVLAGDTRSVGAAGGWLQGVGLSHTSRQYGLGIDNALRFEAVLPTGEAVAADACENPDLFWALRGGGGGTFGVVTHVQYKLHPPARVAYIEIYMEEDEAAARLFLDYWTKKSPYFDRRVAGAWFTPYFAEIYIVGDENEVNERLFLDDFDDWMDNTLYKTNFTGGYTYYKEDSWYDMMGGSNATDEFEYDCRNCSVPEYWSTRLIPDQMVKDDPEMILEFLMTIVTNYSTFGAYWLGGAVNDVHPDATAVHPAMRSSVWAVSTFTKSGAAFVRSKFPNDISGCSFNHHAVGEPEWRTALWGDKHYRRLLGIKNRYDPNRRLNCWHCVGYQGVEYEEEELS